MNFAFKVSFLSLITSLWCGFLNWVEWRMIWPAVVVFAILSFLTWGFYMAEGDGRITVVHTEEAYTGGDNDPHTR